jgi:hypothetical protein
MQAVANLALLYELPDSGIDLFFPNFHTEFCFFPKLPIELRWGSLILTDYFANL